MQRLSSASGGQLRGESDVALHAASSRASSQRICFISAIGTNGMNRRNNRNKQAEEAERAGEQADVDPRRHVRVPRRRQEVVRQRHDDDLEPLEPHAEVDQQREHPQHLEVAAHAPDHSSCVTTQLQKIIVQNVQA